MKSHHLAQWDEDVRAQDGLAFVPSSCQERGNSSFLKHQPALYLLNLSFTVPLPQVLPLSLYHVITMGWAKALNLILPLTGTAWKLWNSLPAPFPEECSAPWRPALAGLGQVCWPLGTARSPSVPEVIWEPGAAKWEFHDLLSIRGIWCGTWAWNGGQDKDLKSELETFWEKCWFWSRR